MSKRDNFRRSLAAATEHDRQEVEFFAAFLRRTDPPGQNGNRRLREWVAEDPEARCEYLGLSPEQAREWGYLP